MPTSITISGFKEFANKCNKLPGELLDKADGVAEDAADTWESLAKLAAPKDIGSPGILSGISNKRLSQGNWEVVSASDHSPYMEFGTRSKARIPADLVAYASQFKGPTGQTDAKKFIFAWAKRVGLPEDAWWPVFISIMRFGVNPHPFFFVQKPIVEAQFIKDLKQIIETPR